MNFSVLLLLTLLPALNACPASAQEVKDHNERALSGPIKRPLRQSRNPNYFEDASSTPLILCGSHTWNTLQDWGAKGPSDRWTSMLSSASSTRMDTILPCC